MWLVLCASGVRLGTGLLAHASGSDNNHPGELNGLGAFQRSPINVLYLGYRSLKMFELQRLPPHFLQQLESYLAVGDVNAMLRTYKKMGSLTMRSLLYQRLLHCLGPEHEDRGALLNVLIQEPNILAQDTVGWRVELARFTKRLDISTADRIKATSCLVLLGILDRQDVSHL